MARQAGTHHITGCYENLCFYKVGGNYYVRKKSSLTSKRVKTDRVFKRTMEYAGLLARASTIASVLYKLLPKKYKGIGVFRTLTGKVMQLLQEAKSEDEIFFQLAKRPAVKPTRTKNMRKPFLCDEIGADALIASVLSDTTIMEAATILRIERVPP